MKKATFTSLIFSLVILFSNCSTTEVGMSYNTNVTYKMASMPTLYVKEIHDQRKHDQYWLGAIRGGYGNALKTLKTDIPVKKMVLQTIEKALMSRNMLTESNKSSYTLVFDLYQFDCNQYVRKEAHIKLGVKVYNKAQKQVYSDTAIIDNIEGSMLSLKTGVFASTDDLKELAEKTLNQAIDKLFDEPKFREVIQ